MVGTSGTLEWADKNYNFCEGCSNNCRYCYAKKMAIRFNRKTEKSWEIMKVRNEQVNRKTFPKAKIRMMIPSTHDITVDILPESIKVLSGLLKVGNKLLIVSKPHKVCIESICKEFPEYQTKIKFRFTIGSDNNSVLKFWEPGAANFEERLECLKIAYNSGYETSVSMEPFLTDPIPVYHKLEQYVTDTIWFGPMNYIARNVLDNEKSEYERVRKLYSKENLKRIHDLSEDFEKIKYKDHFLKKIKNLLTPAILPKNSIENWIKQEH